MILSREQEEALKLILEWMKSDRWYFNLGGYAGTGKTTLIQLLINEYYPKSLCCAPTGKAAMVLGSKIPGVEVTTIHKLLYNPVIPKSQQYDQLMSQLANCSPQKREELKKDKSFISKMENAKKALSEAKLGFYAKDIPEITPGQLVIIDEASMVTKQMCLDFERAKCKALFVGDPGQLPPVGNTNWFLDATPHFVLQEVQRQALDSPIIRLSMAVRNGEIPQEFSTAGCRIVNKKNVSLHDWHECDQVITGRNESRQKLNRFFRNLKYGDAVKENNYLPLQGDKLICLKNERQFFVNGEQFIANKDAYNPGYQDNMGVVDVLCADRFINDMEFYDYDCRSNYVTNLIREPWEFRQDLREIDYAYAITAHKAQGSEWGSVIIADDNIQINNVEFRKRWLYTAITRAKNKLLWVRP